MALQEQKPEGILTIRWVRADRIAVEARELDSSFVLAPDEVIEDWPPTTVESIDDAALERIVALNPQVVLLGTGPRQRFLPPKQQAALLRRGIGIESMDNAAAARTYNLLAAEGRRVVAAFLLCGRESGIENRES